jgi:multisubunit Na+/H+ antiporter MnhB subunit
MENGALYLLAADVILFVHVLFVAFVVFGLACIVIGKLFYWAWVRNPWFRWAHIAGVGIVVLQSWLGAVCQLTNWEMAFREKAGDAAYSGAFIAHWLESILYYRLPDWIFVVSYTLFGALVATSWFWVRPRRFGKGEDHGGA